MSRLAVVGFYWSSVGDCVFYDGRSRACVDGRANLIRVAVVCTVCLYSGL